MAKTNGKTSSKASAAAGGGTAVATKPPKASAKAEGARSSGAPKAAARNGKHLVIVESPAKAKTINKYLGDDFIVKASMGHVRDLPSKGMGVDLETFEPEYVVIEERGKDKVVSELKKLAKDSRPTSTWQPTWTARARRSPGT